MHSTPVFFWFRMTSVAMEVLPVWRSPMISSRWPRPMGNIESVSYTHLHRLIGQVGHHAGDGIPHPGEVGQNILVVLPGLAELGGGDQVLSLIHI